MEIYYDISQVKDKKKWEIFLKKHSNSNIFQSIEMFNFFNTQKNIKSICFFVESNKGECLAFCNCVLISNYIGLIKWLSRRVIIFGGPLINDNINKDELFNFLFKNIENFFKKRSVYVEIRNFCENDYDNLIINNKKWDYLPYQNFIIKLKTEGEVFSKFNSEKRRQIRKAFREGAEISYEKSEKNIMGVYKILNNIYKKKVKKPLPELNFFRNLVELDHAGIVAIYNHDSIIGGAFFLYDDHTIYDWYRGGLDFEYKKQYPSTLSVWAVMLYGINNNLTNFDFMGAGIKGEDYGVRKFKSQFGGELVEYGRLIKIFNPFVYRIGLFGIKLLSKFK